MPGEGVSRPEDEQPRVNPAASTNHFTVRLRTGLETVIAISGELDLAAVPVFESVLEDIDFSSVRGVVLDLEKLAFIDLSGLRSVLRLHESCLERSVVLSIRPGPRAVQRLFELTRTDCLLPFVYTGPTNM
jgi:anti-anti-sigma factor